jgi:hypothetical protein
MPHDLRVGMKRWLAAAALPAWLLAAPAQAADIRTIGCALDRLDPAAAAALRAGQRDIVEKRPVPPIDSAREKLDVATRLCAAENHWSDAAIDIAYDFTFATVVLPVIEDAMRADGMDPRRAERAFQTLTVEQRGEFSRDGGNYGPPLRVLNEALAREGLSLATERLHHEVGLFASAMSAIDHDRLVFPTL